MICSEPKSNFEVRRATVEDAADICEVVRRSILKLCGADHGDDPEILARWLDNKTPENFAGWLANPTNINLVVVEGDCVLAAGCVTTAGEIILNYVEPNARFRGASDRLLAALEAEARDCGVAVCTLESTTTARRFYQDRGYEERAPPSSKFGLTTWPMSRRI